MRIDILSPLPHLLKAPFTTSILAKAIEKKIDCFITSDLKYHDFFKAEKKILLLDIGHFESEQYTKNLIMEYLNEKMPNFGVALAETATNPVKYK